MQSLDVLGYDMPYLDVGEDRDRPPLVCVHGSLSDFRVWGCVLGPLTQRHRMIVPSLRHFFPAQWDGVGDTYSIAQHVSDVIAFIEKLDLGPVDLMGHSRGGHICFRVAQQRPDLLRRLVLAEPGGELDASLDPDYAGGPSPLLARFTASAEKIAAGDVDGGLAVFVDTLEGPGTWPRLPAMVKQNLRDNATTLIGQLADAGADLLLTAHRELRAVDAARAPGDGAEADPGVEQGKMLVGHDWVPGLASSHAPIVISVQI